MVSAQMSRLSIAIVGHPDRQDLVDNLRQQLKPDAVCMDTENLGCGRNHLRAIQQAYGHAVEHYSQWIVVLEDDSVPVPDFRKHASEALQYAPTKLVSFYLGINHPSQYQYNFSKAVKEQVSWIVHPSMRHAVGYAIGTKYVPSLRECMIPLLDRNWAPDDAISEYAKSHEHLVSYTNPSIIDHQDFPSVIQNRTHLGLPVLGKPLARKAHRYGIPKTWDSTYTTVQVP